MVEDKVTPEMIKALNKFRTQLIQPKKTADNPFFKMKYVALEGVMEAIYKALDGTDLAYIQKVRNMENGEKGVETLIFHSTVGVLYSGVFSLMPKKNDPQGFGASITYAKRYQLSAMFGISSDIDDDANAAIGNRYPTKNEPRPRSVPKARKLTEKELQEYQVKYYDGKAKLSKIWTNYIAKDDQAVKWIHGKHSTQTGIAIKQLVSNYKLEQAKQKASC